MSAESYAVPGGRHRLVIVERRSRFVATVTRTATVDQARAFIDAVRAEMPDATHHVYAFCVGSGASVTCGMSDAGEPAGTAGRPVLAVVQGSGLGDVCVVVTRYFGGTKLGTGGLVRAYSEAARLVLAGVPRELREERRAARLVLSYAQYESSRRHLEAHRAVILEAAYGATVDLVLDVPASEWPALSAAIADATAGKCSLRAVDPAG